MRRTVIVMSFAFAVALAVVVGNRMSTEAMAVVVGVVCGVAAAIPMSALILLVSRRRERLDAFTQRGAYGSHQGAYPPVVVIQGGTPTPTDPLPPYYGSAPEAIPRQFHIVGEED
jgi:hypothetical protein